MEMAGARRLIALHSYLRHLNTCAQLNKSTNSYCISAVYTGHFHVTFPTVTLNQSWSLYYALDSARSWFRLPCTLKLAIKDSNDQVRSRELCLLRHRAGCLSSSVW